MAQSNSKLNWHAANRFGLGACRRDLTAMSGDPRSWLHAQLATEPAPFAVESSASLLVQRQAQLQARRAAARGGESPEVADAMRREVRSQVMQSSATRVRHALVSTKPLQERLVRFWSNHFTVSQRGRALLAGLGPAYEKEAIRAHLGGSFAAMLTAVVRHPVMLIYLDNTQSAGPGSRFGRRRGRGRNENLAREVLELHTLGVDGGYKQDDVVALANALTGWTVGNRRLQRFGAHPGQFVFVDAMHEPGAVRVLGKRYSDGGSSQALNILFDLAGRPETARHLAAKLVRHFVDDRPPASAVARVERVWLATGGHLPSVHAALIDTPAAWQTPTAKFRRPEDLLLAVGRGLPEVAAAPDRGLLAALRTLGQVPFTAPSPAGWSDVAEHWAAPGALRQRIEWGLALGRRLGGAIDAREMLPVLVSPGERGGLDSALARAADARQALGLLLAAPQLQWR